MTFTKILLIISLIFVLSCSKKDEPESNVLDISITPQSLIVAGLNSNYSLSVSGTLNNGNKIDSLNSVSWNTSDVSVASIDASGMVTVHALGKVRISASYEGVTNVATIEIVEVAKLTLFPETVEITALDHEFEFNLVVQDKDDRTIARFSDAIWVVDNEAIAEASSNGVFTSKAVGNSFISASFGDISTSSNIVITETAESIRGNLLYKDKLYTESGFFGSDLKAIRYATVELLDEQNQILMTTSSNNEGSFDFGNFIPDNYYIRFLSEIKNAPAAGFSVKDLSGNIFAVRKVSSEATFNYEIILDEISAIRGAFNLLDVAAYAAEFSQQVLNVEATELTVFWQPSNDKGTYYCTGVDAISCRNGKGIYILSGSASSADTDEFDDDVILHEYAHYLTENYSVDESPGGVHSLAQDDSDLRLSWSEGWGTFFPFAVKSWLISNRPDLMSSQVAATRYVDTIGSSAYISHDIAIDEGEENNYFRASSEAAISRVLWGLHQEFGMVRIWEVMADYFTDKNRPDNPINLPVFWDGLIKSDSFSAPDLANLEAIFSERKIDYSADGLEMDNALDDASLQKINITPVDFHTIYSTPQSLADNDMIAFDAIAGNQYTIKTIELYNGIDTLIRLYDSDGKRLAENDDADPGAYFVLDPKSFGSRSRNNRTAMSSKIKFSAPANGRYYVEVVDANKQSSEFDFLGHYGSYKLIIESVL